MSLSSGAKIYTRNNQKLSVDDGKHFALTKHRHYFKKMESKWINTQIRFLLPNDVEVIPVLADELLKKGLLALETSIDPTNLVTRILVKNITARRLKMAKGSMIKFRFVEQLDPVVIPVPLARLQSLTLDDRERQLGPEQELAQGQSDLSDSTSASDTDPSTDN